MNTASKLATFNKSLTDPAKAVFKVPFPFQFAINALIKPLLQKLFKASCTITIQKIIKEIPVTPKEKRQAEAVGMPDFYRLTWICQAF